MLENGLTELSDTDLVLVLGHHPIDWFLNDEVNSIRSLFARHSAVYLHGHLHKPSVKKEEEAGSRFSSVQAGASFQARENEKWVNRMLWVEIDIVARELAVKPLAWSRDNQEWSVDSLAFPNKYRIPGKDYWLFKVSPPKSEIGSGLTANNLSLPTGWCRITKDALESYRKPLDDNEVVTFFDGRMPSWREALSPKIPRRSVVVSLVKAIRSWRANPISTLFLIKGAGGEGKSTLLLQVLVDLLGEGIINEVIWNESSEQDAPDLDQLSGFASPCILASDDAENVAKELFRLVKNASMKGQAGICLLLSCRDTDWLFAECDQIPWRNYVTVAEQGLRGLSRVDAESIISAWALFERRGLGKLYGLSQEEAVNKLMEEARSEVYWEEGAFLGAMLRTRLGDDIKDHVRDLLTKLGKVAAPGGTLREAFAHIAVPHAGNVLMLSKGPLAKALGCNRQDLAKKILGPLGEEAAVAPSSQFILTRHRAIAETAVSILSNTFHVDIDEILLRLLKAALELSDYGIFVPKLGSWRFLSTHFFNVGKRELGVRLAQLAHEHDLNNPFFIVQFAKLLRESGQPDFSVEIFRRAPQGIKRDRTFYFEWGISEGVANKRCNSIWLAASSLADNVDRAWPSTEDATKALAGMGTTFCHLYDLYGAPVFIEACGATAQLGLSIRHDEKGAEYFHEAETLSREACVEKVSLPEALERLKKGVLAAWERREDDLSKWIQDAPKLKYEHLARLLQVELEGKGSTEVQ